MASTPPTDDHEEHNDVKDSVTSAGEKRGIEHEKTGSSPDHKRTKISRPDDETRTTLGETLSKASDGTKDQAEATKDYDAANDLQRDRDAPSEPTGPKSTAEQTHRDAKVPFSILEKGIIYFFFRARVNIENPEEVDDIARSYIILRPMALNSKLGKGPIGDAGNTRLLALPKKVLPHTGRDRFMIFCEKSGASFEDLKNEFLSGSEKETKTRGTTHTPAATPAGEGVYAITTTGRESHLAYMLTLPSDLGEVQNDLGLKKSGSFIISTKNPEYSGPANTRLPKSPSFPKEILDEFRSLRWLPSKPEHLDYVNSQILMIGEPGGIEKAMEQPKKDAKEVKEEPIDVISELEDEDTRRMEDLGSDDSAAIFADLEVQAKDYPKLRTTFS